MSVAAVQDWRKRQRCKSSQITHRALFTGSHPSQAKEIVVFRPQDPNCSDFLVVTVTLVECSSFQRGHLHSQWKFDESGCTVRETDRLNGSLDSAQFYYCVSTELESRIGRLNIQAD